nr:hypothetical protein [Tanacetum cinerariifolium]
VVPTATEVATSTVSIPTGSGVVSTACLPIPTASPIFTTATESTSYTRRKGKETMVESKTPKKKKGMTLEEIKEKFDPVWKQFQDFIPIGSKKEAEKTSKEVKATEEVLEEKVKEMMQLVPVEEVYLEALQVKHPIID